jgi:hypothetical protein
MVPNERSAKVVTPTRWASLAASQVALRTSLSLSGGSFSAKARAAVISSISPVGLPSFLTIPTMLMSSPMPAISNALLFA